MEFDEYQRFCKSTAIYPNQRNNIQYVALGLAGESGEFANKVKKVEHDYGGKITYENRDAMAGELGDALWYIAMAADELGYSLADIIDMNVAKLTIRKERGTVSGSGDNR